jgi:hypothetical protein
MKPSKCAQLYGNSNKSDSKNRSRKNIETNNFIEDNTNKIEKNNMNNINNINNIDLHKIFAHHDGQIDLSIKSHDIEQYWSCFELSKSDQQRIFSDQIHPEDIWLLWDYVIVNFFRLKVLGESREFIAQRFLRKAQEFQAAFSEELIPHKIHSDNQSSDNQSKYSNPIQGSKEKEAYFWKIESAAIQMSLQKNILESKEERIQNFRNPEELHSVNMGLRNETEYNETKFNETKFNEDEIKIIQRLSLLYRSIYNLISQGDIFGEILSSQSVEIIPSSDIFKKNPGIVVEGKKSKNPISKNPKSKNPMCYERRMHKKFFALCFLASYAQFQDMWRALIIGYQLYLSEEKAKTFVDRFNLYSDSVSSNLGKSLMLFSSTQKETSIFQPRESNLYNKVFLGLYQSIKSKNPSFLYFNPPIHSSSINRAEIFRVKSLFSKSSESSKEENIQKPSYFVGHLDEALDSSTTDITFRNTRQNDYIKGTDDVYHDVYRFENPIKENRDHQVSIRMTIHESFESFFDHMMYESITPLEEDRIPESNKYIEENFLVNREEKISEEKIAGPAKINFEVLLEKAKRKSFQLYKWNAWSKISKYSIDEFLEPQLFERSVTAEATTNIVPTKIIPCHLLHASSDLEITLLVYQHRLFLQILGELSDVDVRADYQRLPSYEVPPEYKELDFIWYELPKEPPDRISITYHSQLHSRTELQSKKEIDDTIESCNQRQEILLQLQSYGCSESFF